VKSKKFQYQTCLSYTSIDRDLVKMAQSRLGWFKARVKKGVSVGMPNGPNAEWFFGRNAERRRAEYRKEM